MKQASIVSVGNEILAGATVDTNAAHISAELLSIGMPVISSYAVGDEIERIVRGIEPAAADADVVYGDTSRVESSGWWREIKFKLFFPLGP